MLRTFFFPPRVLTETTRPRNRISWAIRAFSKLKFIRLYLRFHSNSWIIDKICKVNIIQEANLVAPCSHTHLENKREPARTYNSKGLLLIRAEPPPTYSHSSPKHIRLFRCEPKQESHENSEETPRGFANCLGSRERGICGRMIYSLLSFAVIPGRNPRRKRKERSTLECLASLTAGRMSFERRATQQHNTPYLTAMTPYNIGVTKSMKQATSFTHSYKTPRV